MLNYSNMSYATQACFLPGDITNHVTIFNFSISLLSCSFRKPRVPNYSNKSYATRIYTLVDDVRSHVTILNLFFFAFFLLISKAMSAKPLQTVICDSGICVAR